jgi:hypothetical protein
MFLGNRARSVRKSDSLVICKPGHFTTIWAYTASYGNSFTFTLIYITSLRTASAV